MKLKEITISIVLFFALLIPYNSISQIFEEFEVDKEESEEEVKKPSNIAPGIRLWQITDFGAFQDSLKLDTLLDNYQIYNPALKNSITSTFVGNYGTPALNNDFFDRNSNVDFLFFQSREVYLLTPAIVQYHNTKTPFTRLDFGQSGNKSVKNETRFNFLHTQNVNPYLNFTLQINMAKSTGQYIAQESKNNFITLYTSYNRDNLNVYAGFITNTVKNNENGGITNDSLLLEVPKSELINTNLEASTTNLKGTYYYVNGEYRFGKIIETEKDSGLFRPIFGIYVGSQYERHQQKFSDEEEAKNTFFENTYYDDAYITDSIRFNKIDNVIQLKQYENAERKTSFGKRAFLGIDFINTTTPGRDSARTAGLDTNRYESIVKNYSNLYVGGGIFREKGKFWTWDFDGKIYLIGQKAGQTELSGTISKPFKVLKDSAASLVIGGFINNKAADYFQEEFYSNHFRWNNNFNMEQRMDVNGSIISPRFKLKLTGNYAIINNFIYNNYEGIPSQTNKELLVLSAFADKDFNYRNLHFRVRALWQKASNEEFIHLPDFSGFVSAYYKFVISKVMFTQIGFDTRYNTMYYADAYSPSTGLFYLQNEKKYGNYPYIDVYANLRLKRTIVFFKMVNIGTGFLDGEYMTTAHYPMPRSSFRFGISWLFYD
ncbi:MAG TPA: putative porin [Draconibacterium sp.]|mgnify:CR=1 FL=1|nr:putative porin [Draconibacterium sp.]